MDKQKVTVRVAGREYTLVSADSVEHLSRVAAFADRQITEMQFAARTSKENAAVLAVLNLSDELMRAQDENARLRRRLAAMHED